MKITKREHRAILVHLTEMGEDMLEAIPLKKIETLWIPKKDVEWILGRARKKPASMKNLYLRYWLHFTIKCVPGDFAVALGHYRRSQRLAAKRRKAGWVSKKLGKRVSVTSYQAERD